MNSVVVFVARSLPCGLIHQSDLTVDKGLLDVTITIPADFGDPLASDFDAEAYAKENGFKKTVVGENGSLTITMSRSKYTELMSDLKITTDQNLDKFIESDDSTYVKSFSADSIIKI